MPYKVLSFIKDHVEEDGKLSIVATIEQQGNEEHPFKVLVEHVETIEQAQKDVQTWIDARVTEDVVREEERVRNEKDAKGDDLIAQLNASLQPPSVVEIQTGEQV